MLQKLTPIVLICKLVLAVSQEFQSIKRIINLTG